MRIALEKDDNELEIVVEEEPPARVQTLSDSLDDPFSKTPPPPKPSRRPTRIMGSVGGGEFSEYVLGALKKAITTEQKDSLRVVIQRGLSSKLISQAEADTFLLLLSKQ